MRLSGILNVCALAVIAVSAACSSGGVTPVAGGGETDGGSAARQLINDGTSVSVAVKPGMVKDVGVTLVQNGMPVAGDKVQFDIEGSRMDSVLLGTGGVTVTDMGTRAQVTTDSAGKAKITVKGGPTNTNFRLKVSDLCDMCTGSTAPAAPIQFAIVVTDEQIGSMSVTLQYTGHMTAALKTFNVRLYKAVHVDCAVNNGGTPANVLAEAAAFTNIHNVTKFDNLPVGSDYSVIVQALDANNNFIAGGCAPASGMQIQVMSGADAKVTVTLGDLPLQVAGTYHVRNVFNFRDAIQGQAGDVIDALTAPFDGANDPGTYLVTLLSDQLGYHQGDFGYDVIINTGATIVNRIIFTVLPSALGTPGEVIARIAAGMRDLTKFLATLEIQSTLVVGTPTSDNKVSVMEKWDSVKLEWQGNSAVFSLTDATNPDFRQTIMVNYMGSVDSNATKTTLTLPDDAVMLNYGRFVGLYLNEILIPAVTQSVGDPSGPHSMGDLLNVLVPCDNLAQAADDFDCQGADATNPNAACHADGWVVTAGIAIPADTIKSSCQAVLNSVGMTIEQKLEDLISQSLSTITLYGNVELKDLDKDRQTEKMTGGAWSLREGATDTATDPQIGCFEGVLDGTLDPVSMMTAEAALCHLQ